VLATIIAIWQYRWTVRYLWGGSFATQKHGEERKNTDRKE